MALIDGKEEKSPAFRLYAADFLVDENVVLMNNTQVGCYIKLICYCWREGSIPDDAAKIAKLVGEDSSVMAELWDGIRLCFVEALDAPGRLVHRRLQEERKKQIDFSKERSEAGRRGAKSRWEKEKNGGAGDDGSAIAKPKAKRMAKDGFSLSSSTDSPHPPKGVRFEEFWSIWPKGERKHDKAKCLDHWKRNSLDVKADTILADITVKLQTQKWKDGYVEAPLVYLRGKRWEDGVEPQSAAGQAKGWWETQSGIRAKGDQLRVPYRSGMASGGAWLRYVAAVWVAAGDGSHWDEHSPVYDIAVGMRGQASSQVQGLMPDLAMRG